MWTAVIVVWLLAAAMWACHGWLPRYRPGWAGRLAWRRRRDLDREVHVAPALAADARPADDRGYRDMPPDIDADRLPWPASLKTMVRGGRSAAIRPRGSWWRDRNLVPLVRIDRKGTANRVRLEVREMDLDVSFLALAALAVLWWPWDGGGWWLVAALHVVGLPLAWWERRRDRAARDREIRAALDEIETALTEGAPPRVRAPEARPTGETEAEQEPAAAMASSPTHPRRTEGRH